ncbi:MAG: class I SAM-dependent methyltransferase [Planctomycetes bacterium]|nr:class I SAM-dependent methyltransferase [Planctomycetota bacterium]
MSETFKDQAVDEFDSWSDTYDEEGFFRRHLFIPTEDHIIKELLSLRKPDENFRMLDIGCATGKLLRKTGEKFAAASFEGVDIAPGMIKVASEKTQDDDRYHFQVGNAAEALPFDDDSFDYVSCCHSFHHYPDQESAAKEFLRLLKPDGKLLFVDSYINSVWGFMMHCVIIGTYEKFQVHHFKKNALKEFFENVGLKVERQDVVTGRVPWMMTVCVPSAEGGENAASEPEEKGESR